MTSTWKTATRLSLIAAAVALSGCRVDSNFDLFTSDVFLVSEGKNDLLTTTRIKIETTSPSDCEANKEQVRTILSNYYPITDGPVCHTEGFDTFMAFGVKVPVMMMPNQSGFEIPNDAPTALGLKNSDNGLIEVWGLVSPSRFDAMEEQFKQLNSSLTLEVGKVQVTLTNDERHPYKVFGPASWIDNIPYFGPSIQLNQRDRVVWQASDVAVGFLSANNFVWLMTIQK